MRTLFLAPRFARDDVYSAVEAFTARAAERGVEPATLAFAWVLGNPDVTAAVAGPSRAAHLAPVLEAYGLELSHAERDELAALFP